MAFISTAAEKPWLRNQALRCPRLDLFNGVSVVSQLWKTACNTYAQKLMFLPEKKLLCVPLQMYLMGKRKLAPPHPIFFGY